MKQFASKTNRRAFLSAALASPWTLPALLEAAGTARAQPKPPKEIDLQELLTPFRRDNSLPAVAAAVVKQGMVIASGAVGIRKVGATVAVTRSDKFHIGSCTKAMTATLAAMLVEQNKLQWTQTLAEVFPERAGKMNPGYRKVSLELLLTHRAGLPANSNDYGASTAAVTVRRLSYMDALINKSPTTEPGTRFAYSNAGYIIVGAILERITGKAWEDLIEEKLFRPLGIASAGFGPCSKENQTDQPWGHVFRDGKFQPRFGDNPRPLGPAGTVHCSMQDYMKFADLHVNRGARPPRLLKSAVFDKLHDPPAKQEYAMGWGVVNRDWAQGSALTHNGSNTMNFFVVWLAPKIDFGLAVASNAAGEKVPEVLDGVAAALVRKFAS